MTAPLLERLAMRLQWTAMYQRRDANGDLPGWARQPQPSPKQAWQHVGEVQRAFMREQARAAVEFMREEGVRL